MYDGSSYSKLSPLMQCIVSKGIMRKMKAAISVIPKITNQHEKEPVEEGC